MSLGLTALMLLLAGCTHVINVERTVEYKCGEQIILAEYLDDESVIIKMNGQNIVLARSETDDGERYDSASSKMTFVKKDNKSIYLSNKGNVYPMCVEIKR